MKFSLPSFARWRSGALAAFTRFPWNILCGATGAACLITLIHTGHNDWLEGQCARLAMAAAIGMPLFFSLRIVRERIPKFTPWPIEIVGLFVLAGWFLTQPPFAAAVTGNHLDSVAASFGGTALFRRCLRPFLAERALGVYLSGFVSRHFTLSFSRPDWN